MYVRNDDTTACRAVNESGRRASGLQVEQKKKKKEKIIRIKNLKNPGNAIEMKTKTDSFRPYGNVGKNRIKRYFRS